MADPGFQVGVGEEIGVDQSTVSRTVNEVANRIVEKKELWIKFPSNIRELEVEKNKWQERYAFPCAVGAVDCTHMETEKPRDHPDEYVNRKGWHSLNVQATCNAEEKFTSVEVRWPGSVHDSRIWRNSAVYRFLRRIDSDAVLLGDQGYGIATFLMVPYRNPATPPQIRFNNVLVRERVIIERCFGQVKRRFPILMYKNRLSLDRVPSVIVSCFILHNVAKHLQEEDFGENIAENAENNAREGDLLEDEEANNNVQAVQRHLGQQRRDNLAEIILNNNI